MSYEASSPHLLVHLELHLTSAISSHLGEFQDLARVHVELSRDAPYVLQLADRDDLEVSIAEHFQLLDGAHLNPTNRQ